MLTPLVTVSAHYASMPIINSMVFINSQSPSRSPSGSRGNGGRERFDMSGPCAQRRPFFAVPLVPVVVSTGHVLGHVIQDQTDHVRWDADATHTRRRRAPQIMGMGRFGIWQPDAE